MANVNRENSNCDELNIPISDLEIRQSIHHLRANKSPGPDGVCLEMYKHTIHIILPFLNALFNEIFENGDFPAQWSQSIITPIHKKGSKLDPNNYRGISLIDSLCKIFVNILTIRLTTWCDNYNVIDESQAGFRKGYSTTDNIFCLMSLIQKYLSKKKGRFYCIYIDFAKAFDSIQHQKLWDAFSRNNINGRFLIIIKSMYAKLKSCVKVNDNLTSFFSCNTGTRQGCVGSPIIFSLFINDLVTFLHEKCDRGIFVSDDIEDLVALMFADDVSSFSDTVINLQHQINCIEEYCKTVNMKINLSKTKIVVFRNGGVL